jgi:hypothetical protein
MHTLDKTSERAVTVGFAGPSCSGKSTLATEVARILGATIVRLDSHWLPAVARPYVNGHPSYERPDQYDGAALLREVEAAKARKGSIVCEGFLLFCYPGMIEACDHAFFLKAPHTVLVARRRERAAIGGDSLWEADGGDAVSNASWLAHGQEEWERFGAQQSSLPDMHVIDAAADTRSIVAAVLCILERTVATTEVLTSSGEHRKLRAGKRVRS